jgi:MinD superfamily P-loop ATPase
MIKIEIDQTICNHCNLCVAACHNGGMLQIDGQIVIVETADCQGCRTCEFICARDAIKWNYEITLTESNLRDNG